MIASSGENYAVVNNGGNLNLTAVQGQITYALGDPFGPQVVNGTVVPGKSPKITGGTYNNNVVGATITLFYSLDYDNHTVAMPQLAANGSSNTGAGVFRTVANLKTRDGKPFVLSPTADLDIYTDANGVNTVVGVSGQTLFSFDLNQIDPNQQVGVVVDVIVTTNRIRAGGWIDVALVTGTKCRRDDD